MHPYAHIAVSSVLSAGLWLILRSLPAAIACFMAGVLVDLDHILDYVINHGWRPRAQHFMRTFKHDVLDHIVVFLHSWELAVPAVLLTWWSGWHPIGIGLLVGALTHLALDQIFNQHSPLAYFLSYRIYHRFVGKKFYGRNEYRTRLKNARQCSRKS